MKLHLIDNYIHAYKVALTNRQVEPDYLFRACSLHWKENFTLEDGYLEEVLANSLKNSYSGRLWNGEKYSIKSGIKSLAKTNEDLLRESFRDLFHNERQLIMKVNRFIHHCDVILESTERKKSEVYTHYQNYYSACLFLALEYPGMYCLHKYEDFELFCKKIGHQNIPIESDLERYFKIIKVINGIIMKDMVFMELYYSLLPDQIYLGPSLDTSLDFISFTAKNE